MVDDLEKTETAPDGDPKPKKRKNPRIPWKSLALYSLPALIVFIIFIMMHNLLVQPPLSKEIVALINNKDEDENSNGNSDDEIKTAETTQEDTTGSDIPFIGPQHFYHSFTGALATDLKVALAY